MIKSFVPLLLLVPAILSGELPSAPITAVIEAPDRVNIGDLVILDSSKSTGDNRLWVVDPRVEGRYLELDQRMVFAIGTPGTYTFQLIVADTKANIAQTKKNVTVGGTVVSPPPVDPVDPTDPVPPPSNQGVFKATKAATDFMADPTTAAQLRQALTSLPEKTPETVQKAIATVMLNRKDQSKDWLSNWRVPVNFAIERSGLSYDQAIQQVIKGLDPSALSSPVTITFYTRPACPPCDLWKANELATFLSYGWNVKPETTTTRTTPAFEINLGDRKILHQGYLSFPAFLQIAN